MFGIQPPFSTHDSPSKETIDLLSSVTLGSNGARYRHIGIENRINQLHNPLYLNLTLRNKPIANVTFCKRQKDWYVRYFAFDQLFQSAPTKKQKSRGKGKLNQQLNDFFSNAIESENEPSLFYAYIDPRNDRSLWMSETFGFTSISKIATQTYSSLNPKNRGVRKLKDKRMIKNLVNNQFGGRPFYHPYQTFNDSPFYVLEENGEIVAFAKSHKAEWVIEQLPGRRGKTLKNIIPFIPVVNKIIRPNAHQFSAIDSVWVKGNDPKYFESLAQGVLVEDNHKVLHWWVDQKEPLWNSLKDKVNWGLLHKINGVHLVNLVVRSKEKNELDKAAYISAFDFI